MKKKKRTRTNDSYELCSLYRTDRAKWKKRVRAVLEKHRSLLPSAAALGVGYTTLWRWCSEHPDLFKGIARKPPGREPKG